MEAFCERALSPTWAQNCAGRNLRYRAQRDYSPAGFERRRRGRFLRAAELGGEGHEELPRIRLRSADGLLREFLLRQGRSGEKWRARFRPDRGASRQFAPRLTGRLQV